MVFSLNSFGRFFIWIYFWIRRNLDVVVVSFLIMKYSIYSLIFRLVILIVYFNRNEIEVVDILKYFVWFGVYGIEFFRCVCVMLFDLG